MDAFFVNIRYALVQIMGGKFSYLCGLLLRWGSPASGMKTVIPFELLKQTPSLFISPSILYNFFHKLFQTF